jgi:tRNA pseudouridine32 synthase
MITSHHGLSHAPICLLTCLPVWLAHQIRVHLQFLGHPIANDTEYSLERVWGPNVGKGGVDVTPAMKPYGLVANMNSNPDDTEPNNTNTRQSLPRETGEDIGLGLRVTLSNQVVDAISALRSIKVIISFVLITFDPML